MFIIILDSLRTFIRLILSWFTITFSVSNSSFQFLSIIIGSECIIRWWNWIQSSKETGSANSDNATAHHNRGMYNCKVSFDNKYKCSFQREIILLYSWSIEAWRTDNIISVSKNPHKTWLDPNYIHSFPNSVWVQWIGWNVILVENIFLSRILYTA